MTVNKLKIKASIMALEEKIKKSTNEAIKRSYEFKLSILRTLYGSY